MDKDEQLGEIIEIMGTFAQDFGLPYSPQYDKSVAECLYNIGYRKLDKIQKEVGGVER